MINLNNLALFLQIVERGSLAAAGREMGLAPATVTERLNALEAHYGTRLLTRTTRSIALTDEGRELLTGARRILDEAEDTAARIRLGAETVSGTIHLSAPVDFGRNRLLPLLDDFMNGHPHVSIDLTLTDGRTDLAAQGFDLGIRYGEQTDTSMKSLKLHDSHRIVCAAPDYLAAHGHPVHPDDLADHNCLVMRFGHLTDQDWPFLINGELRTFRVIGNRLANDGDIVRRWCVAGYGIALKSESDIRADIEARRLVALLSKFSPPPNALRLIYPAGSTQPRRVRTLMEFLSNMLR